MSIHHLNYVCNVMECDTLYLERNYILAQNLLDIPDTWEFDAEETYDPSSFPDGSPQTEILSRGVQYHVKTDTLFIFIQMDPVCFFRLHRK